MTTKNAKTILFASLIAAMILPFSGTQFAVGQDTEDRDFLAEWKVLQAQVDVLVQKQVAAKNSMDSSSNTDEIMQIIQNMDVTASEIETLNQKIDALEQESINSLKMAPQLEKALFTVEKEIIKTYKGETPVWGAYVDFKLQKVVVFIDNTLEGADEITEILVNQFGSDVVEIDNNIPAETACSSQTSTCRPLIGGIALARYDDSSNLAGTLGYKARDSSGNTGFVTAEHVVDYYSTGNIWMKQPVNGGLVGYATIMGEGTSNLDFAFVRTTTSINDDIFQSSNKVMDVTGYATTHSQHYPGTFLYGKGVTSGEYSGTVNGYSSDGWYRLGGSNPQGGDSGGPVYKKFAGAHGTYTVHVYGHMFNNAGFYGSVHGVINNYNVTPLTS